MNISTRITVNGHSYHSVDEMPPEVREQYERAMAMLKGGGGAPDASAAVTSVVNESIVYNGHRYKSRDELPPEVRALLNKMPAAPGKTGDVRLETTRTIGPQVTFNKSLPDDGRPAPEEDPVLAWTLVKILVVAVIILLFLLGAKHYGWW